MSYFFRIKFKQFFKEKEWKNDNITDIDLNISYFL